MNDIQRIFQAFVAPAIFISATALLILSINVRFMGIVSRLRHFAQARHNASRSNRLQEAEAFAAQINSVEQRAEIVRRSFLLALIALVGLITSSLLLGVGLYWKDASVVAVAVFVTAMFCLLLATYYYIREVVVSLSSVRDESRDVRFMELGAPYDRRGREAV